VLEEKEKWASVSLRLFGDQLPVADVSSRLDLPAYRVGRKGEHLHGNPRYAIHKTNLWLWSVTSMHKVALENQLVLTLDVLETRLIRLKELLQETGANAELFIGFGSGNGQGGVAISPSVLKRLAALGLPLQFDLYPPDVDETSD